MGDVKSYRDLRVWQQGIQIVKEVYRLVKKLPKEETYALSDQLRRAAVSIPANIAEGQAKQHTRDYCRHLPIAKGSLDEVDTLFVIAGELGYVQQDEITHMESKLRDLRMPLQGLINRLQQHIS
jgi:four helix bundle protein